MSSTYSAAGYIPVICTWNMGNILLSLGDAEIKFRHLSQGKQQSKINTDVVVHRPSGFSDNHLCSQLVKLLPERMHLQLHLYPSHLGGLDGRQRPPVQTGRVQRRTAVLWLICEEKWKNSFLVTFPQTHKRATVEGTTSSPAIIWGSARPLIPVLWAAAASGAGPTVRTPAGRCFYSLGDSLGTSLPASSITTVITALTCAQHSCTHMHAHHRPK